MRARGQDRPHLQVNVFKMWQRRIICVIIVATRVAKKRFSVVELGAGGSLSNRVISVIHRDKPTTIYSSMSPLRRPLDIGNLGLTYFCQASMPPYSNALITRIYVSTATIVAAIGLSFLPPSSGFGGRSTANVNDVSLLEIIRRRMSVTAR